MRRFIIACVLFALTMGGLFFVQYKVSTSAEELYQKTEPLMTAVMQSDKGGAERAWEDFHTTWEKEKNWMYLILAHERLDDIEEKAHYAIRSIQSDEMTAAMESVGIIQTSLLYVRDRDALLPKNLF